jgi:methylated-DNA-[protein]-cysteine S-methyltransferase
MSDALGITLQLSTAHLGFSFDSWQFDILRFMELQAVGFIDSPLGTLAVGATDRGVAQLSFVAAGQRRAAFSNSALSQSHVQIALSQLEEYFAGERKKFDLKFDLIGTAFQRSVWSSLAELASSEIVSYGELANKIGKPLAARAVGGAVGANPIPIIIGCHRVLGSSGKLTGYSGAGGLDTKRWLLNFEGIGYRG